MTEDLSPDANEFRCLFPFPDGSDSFVHGFEAGMIWQRMIAGENPIEHPIAFHVANREVFENMAAAQGYEMIADASLHGFEEWFTVEFRKRPKRFAVIEGGVT